jgi:xylulose-5-phosphate/fructose-6-phosphate phosphoketolase
MIYLQDNPLLKELLKHEHIKNRLLGHWGARPGLAFTYTHLNRLIKKYDLDMNFMAGPGHGAPGLWAQSTSKALTPRFTPKGKDAAGLREFFRQFSFPGGIGSHCTPENSRVDP